MALVTKFESNGTDVTFKLTGVGLANVASQYVSVSNSSGGRSNASITSWTGTQIIGTLPSDKKLPSGTLFIVSDVQDNLGNTNPTPSNSGTYTIT